MSAISNRCLRALAEFGLVHDAGWIGPIEQWSPGIAQRHPPHLETSTLKPSRTIAELRPGSILAIVGPSGSGKSSLLREFERGLRRLGRRALRACPSMINPGVRVIDQLDCPLPRAMGLLSTVGLAEGALVARRGVELSDGERHRFALALAIDRWKPGDVICIDEFGSPLDAATRAALAHALARWTRRAGASLIVAGVREDIIEPLTPESVIECSLGAAPAFTRRTSHGTSHGASNE